MSCLGQGGADGERLTGLAFVVGEAVWQVHLRAAEQEVEGFHERLDPSPVRAGVERLAPRAAEQQLAAHLVRFDHGGERLLRPGRRLLALPVSSGVVGERSPKALGDPDVVDDQPAGLVSERAVDTGDGLHRARRPSSACPRTSCAAMASRSRSATCRGR